MTFSPVSAMNFPLRSRIFLLLALVVLFAACESEADKRRQARTGKGDSSESESTAAPVAKKATFSAYIESSASLDGYVKGATEFESKIYQLLVDVQSGGGQTSPLSLFFINTDRKKQPADLDEFIRTLEPSTFRERVGKRSTTDISEVLETVLSHTRRDTVSILVSDFVFSPGSGKDAQAYLANQKVGINSDLNAHLRQNPDHAILVLQGFSQFNGDYYDRTNKPIALKNARRPFYVWFIGHKDAIATVLPRLKTGEFAQTAYFVGGSGAAKLALKNSKRFAVGASRTEVTGSSLRVTEAAPKKTAGGSEFAAAVGVDLRAFAPMGASLTDPALWRVSNPGYEIRLEAAESGGAYTHHLVLTSKAGKVHEGKFTVSLHSALPAWVAASTSADDTRIASEKAEMSRTFGLKACLEGVLNAYQSASGGDKLASFDVQIKAR